MSDKLSIQNEMRAFDCKDRDFYNNLTEEEKRKFSTFLIMKYGGNVEGSADLQEWYLRAHNERVNQNFFDISKHPNLQWLVCTTVSPDMGSQKHYWLNSKKKESDSKAIKFLESQFPHLDSYELELMAQINTKDQLRDMARGLGWDEKRIKNEL
jgi:hypothetical protein